VVKRALAVAVLGLAFPAPAQGWGGVYDVASDGTPIQVNVADSYPVDPALPQKWADYLGSLVHGPELSKLILNLQPRTQVSRICGLFAVACYSPHDGTMYITPDDAPGAPSAQEVVAHEYGHHVAANRVNPPWSALTWGTKRWASYENICARTARGELHPGDEGNAYKLNPGEAFAESFRVLNEQRLGFPALGWNLVDQSLFPDPTALQLIEEDVTQPWTGNTSSTLHGSFGGGVRRTFTLRTPLDGSLRLSLAGPRAFRMSLYNGTALAGSGRSIGYQLCGERTLTLRIDRGKGSGAFTISVSKP
jgi:hypothetical protein